MTPLALTALIMGPAVLVVVAIVALIVIDHVVSYEPPPPGRHRTPQVIDSVVISSDTIPIRVGGAS